MSVLSRAVAYWKMVDYSGSGDLLDGSGNGHHAQFGSTGGADTNDPLPLLNDGTQYAYFPGSADNEVSVAGLSNSTVYDYTVTYLDDSFEVGEETTDGSGNLVLGNTQANFSDKSVKTIVVVPDGGGATQASADFTNRTDIAKPFASFTGGEGKTWTISRSATGVKLSIVDIPLALHGTDDYLEVADHADLDFANGDDFSVVFVGRMFNTAHASANQFMGKGLIYYADGNAGWGISRDWGAARVATRIQDGTTGRDVQATEVPLADGVLFAAAGVRNTGDDDLTTLIDGDAGTPVTDTTEDTLANATALTIGKQPLGGTWFHGEFAGAAIFREALSGADTAAAGEELLSRGIAVLRRRREGM